jgi:hypothetical protein
MRNAAHAPQRHLCMTPEAQLERLAHFDEGPLFTAAMQLMWRIDERSAQVGEEATRVSLLDAIDDLCLGPWHEFDESLVTNWPYGLEYRLLAGLLQRLEEVSSDPRALKAVVTARWLLAFVCGPGVGFKADFPSHVAGVTRRCSLAGSRQLAPTSAEARRGLADQPDATASRSSCLSRRQCKKISR